MSENILLKNVHVIDSQSSYNGKKVDILIEKGIISKIGKSINAKAKTVEMENLHVSPGWLDMHANFCEPGFEHKEDLLSGMNAAIAGGFTGVAIMPSTNPPIDNKSAVEYILNRTKNCAVDIYPIACLSEKREGKNIAEMYDLHLAGAVAFSDGKKSVDSADLMKRALLYTKQFNGLTIQYANDASLSKGGQMNEGEISTTLGLKGIPELAEDIAISKDLFLTEYTDGKIHFTTVSSPGGIEQIRRAKKNGLKVTADVAAHQLFFDDEALEEFDTNLKTLPPIRSKSQVKKLVKALKENTIDVIVSDHTPVDIEGKKLEFDHADFGMIGLQTAFSAANMALMDQLSLDDLIRKMTSNPRKVLNLEEVKVELGSKANLTLFNPTLHWTLEANHIKSKSKNSPFIGMELVGKPLGIYNKGKLTLS